jgi:hypothetical protein
MFCITSRSRYTYEPQSHDDGIVLGPFESKEMAAKYIETKLKAKRLNDNVFIREEDETEIRYKITQMTDVIL